MKNKCTTIIVALKELGHNEETAKKLLNNVLEDAFEAGKAAERQNISAIVGESVGYDGPDFWEWLEGAEYNNDAPQRKTALEWSEAIIARLERDSNNPEYASTQYKIALMSRIAILKQLQHYIKGNPYYSK